MGQPAFIVHSSGLICFVLFFALSRLVSLLGNDNPDTSSFDTVIEFSSSQNYGLMLSALPILKTQKTFLTNMFIS